MSNNNELNTDEQIEQVNQPIEDMEKTSADTGNNDITNQETFSEETNTESTIESDRESNTNSDATMDKKINKKDETEKKDEPLTFGLEDTNSAEQHTDTAEKNNTTENTAENAADEQAAPQENTTNVANSAPQKEAENAVIPSTAEKCFNIFSKLGLPLLILFTLILCGQQFLFPRDFWFSEEVRYADIYMNMLSSHNFFTLTLNGHPYAETGPLYFIFVWLLDAVPTINMPQAFFGASILFAVFFVASTWILARGIGYSKKVAFAAGLLALSMFFLASFTNYTRMDLLFAGFLNLSYVCFFRAWQKKSAPIWLLFAFLFLCFASLTSTFIAFVFPFIASLLFFLWTAKYKRINSTDGIIGFLISILIIFAWFAYLYLQGNAEYISLLLDEQLIQNFSPTADFKTEPYWYYLAGLPLALFPWVFILLFASWGKWLKNCPQAFKARKQNNAGAWLILLIVTHIGVYSLFKDKSFSNLVTVIPFFAILFAKSILGFSPLRSKIFFGFLALLTSLCGIFFIVLEFHGYILEYLPNLWILPKEIPAFIEVLTTNTYFGLTTMGVILILLGVLLWYGVKRQFVGGTLLIYTIGIILTLQPVNLLVAPQMGTVFSTKNHAYEMAKVHQKEDAVPASYHIYPDVFTYYYNEALDSSTYSKATIAEFNDIEALTEFLLNTDKVILAISEKDFQELPYKNEATILAYKQWIEHQYIILTYWNISSHKPNFEDTSKEMEKLDNNMAIVQDNTGNSGTMPAEQDNAPLVPAGQDNSELVQDTPLSETDTLKQSTEQNVQAPLTTKENNEPKTGQSPEQATEQAAKETSNEPNELSTPPTQEQKTLPKPSAKEVTL